MRMNQNQNQNQRTNRFVARVVVLGVKNVVFSIMTFLEFHIASKYSCGIQFRY